MNVSLCNLRVVRGDWSLAVQGIFHEGIHLVSGDVGSGKSTLALLLAGFLSPESGTVERQNISSLMMGFQSPEYHITGSTLEEECQSWNVDPDPVLASMGLAEKKDTDPLKLSRGELKRLILGCMLAGHYDLLVLDEPFSSLDCYEKERLCCTLSARSTGITLLFTHERTFFPRVDRIWEIRHGTLHDLGGLPEALEHWEHAPAAIKNLIARGKIPVNISQDDLREAACRT
jgi:energy-coupling factor transport system ATP-binding protein